MSVYSSTKSDSLCGHIFQETVQSMREAPYRSTALAVATIWTGTMGYAALGVGLGVLVPAAIFVWGASNVPAIASSNALSQFSHVTACALPVIAGSVVGGVAKTFGVSLF